MHTTPEDGIQILNNTGIVENKRGFYVIFIFGIKITVFNLVLGQSG
jgi:hypothetical protein